MPPVNVPAPSVAAAPSIVLVGAVVLVVVVVVVLAVGSVVVVDVLVVVVVVDVVVDVLTGWAGVGGAPDVTVRGWGVVFAGADAPDVAGAVDANFAVVAADDACWFERAIETPEPLEAEGVTRDGARVGGSAMEVPEGSESLLIDVGGAEDALAGGGVVSEEPGSSAR